LVRNGTCMKCDRCGSTTDVRDQLAIKANNCDQVLQQFTIVLLSTSAGLFISHRNDDEEAWSLSNSCLLWAIDGQLLTAG